MAGHSLPDPTGCTDQPSGDYRHSSSPTPLIGLLLPPFFATSSPPLLIVSRRYYAHSTEEVIRVPAKMATRNKIRQVYAMKSLYRLKLRARKPAGGSFSAVLLPSGDEVTVIKRVFGRFICTVQCVCVCVCMCVCVCVFVFM